jgi:hypothetical protein
MKPVMILYMIALIYRKTKASSKALAEWFERVSHDQITRMLNEAHNWPTRLWQDFSSKVSEVYEGGYLEFDDTILEKFGREIFGVYWVYSSTLQKAVRGINVVLLLWTDGKRRIPIGIKIWHKAPSGKTKRTRVVLAGQLLRWAHKLGLKPSYVVFDSWYAAKPLLNQIRSYGWHFTTRLKPNRKFNGKQLRRHWPHRFAHASGKITGGIWVLIVKDGKRFLATSDLSLSVVQVKRCYALRQQIEEVFKILKSQLAWSHCPARSQAAQLAHIHLCLCAFVVLDQEAARSGSTPYQIRSSLFRQAVPLYSHLFQPFMAAA